MTASTNYSASRYRLAAGSVALALLFVFGAAAQEPAKSPETPQGTPAPEAKAGIVQSTNCCTCSTPPGGGTCCAANQYAACLIDSGQCRCSCFSLALGTKLPDKLLGSIVRNSSLEHVELTDKEKMTFLVNLVKATDKNESLELRTGDETVAVKLSVPESDRKRFRADLVEFTQTERRP